MSISPASTEKEQLSRQQHHTCMHKSYATMLVVQGSPHASQPALVQMALVMCGWQAFKQGLLGSRGQSSLVSRP